MRGPSPFFLMLVLVTGAGAGLAAVGSGAVLVAGIVLLVLGGWAVSLCLHEFAHALVVAVVPMSVGLAAGLSCLALIEVLAFMLNILPVPGLDGFGVLEPYLPDGPRRLAERVRPWAPLVLLVVLLGLPGASRLLF